MVQDLTESYSLFKSSPGINISTSIARECKPSTGNEYEGLVNRKKTEYDKYIKSKNNNVHNTSTEQPYACFYYTNTFIKVVPNFVCALLSEKINPCFCICYVVQ